VGEATLGVSEGNIVGMGEEGGTDDEDIHPSKKRAKTMQTPINHLFFLSTIGFTIVTICARRIRVSRIPGRDR